MDDRRWPSEWLRGVLSLCVLGVVARSDAHGYAIATELAAAGLGRVKGGTLYPVLARLEAEGLVASSWQPGEGGPGRKVFTITPAGEQALAERTEEWDEFTQRAASLLPSRRTAP